jgi:hypothetical protein
MSIEIEAIKKVSLSKGDMVVIRYPEKLEIGQLYTVKEFAKAGFPDNQVIILDGGASIDIITPRADTINSTINMKGVSYDDLICVKSIVDAVKRWKP